ncbi:hypothetical protein [Morganella morganii]|uniref:hypothetical protein n=1 Tax=Morganella morganii TaxID=582 RepID=UPI000B41CA78|nr:hypothetical protein [Morganella morganii]MBT0448279.1 hypothetical protein [Morganella morganii subsp. morganii]QXO48872.1 hypothetical protein JC861_13475 [Morganella morganii]QXO60477.1 hypothetical protein JC826_13315 [Morganella morganii]QXO68005.1 hypothetical protein JC792_13320 [Morganella morganii]QXO79440.1 hypothetical protein JA116_13410 [Morganella morganii]
MHINQIELVTAIAAEIQRQKNNAVTLEPRYFNTIIKAANMVCEEFKKPIVRASHGMGLKRWMSSDDTGLSSLYMASVLSDGGFTAEFAFPWDPSDFGRCIRLIEAVPEMAGFISKMQSHGPEWTAIVANWEEWKKLYHDENGEELYRQMKDAYAKYRAAEEK